MLFAISMGVFAVIVVLLWRSLLHRAREADTSETTERRNHRWVLWAGLIGPSLVLAGVWVLVVVDLRALSGVGEPDGVVVEVTGMQWWWDVAYPDLGVRTANEVHVPAGEPVTFQVTSGDVQHSFWTPQAGPKRDMYPHIVNELAVQIDEPGVFTGICSEFCGLQHARMHFLLIAHPPDEFDEWVAANAAPAVEPQSSAEVEGREVFLRSNCVGCHTIRGVSEASALGPDLTHLADRQILAADVDLDMSALREFVEDPHQLKEGVLMPPAGLSDEELDALVAYLETLR